MPSTRGPRPGFRCRIILLNTDFAGPQLHAVATREHVDLLVYDEEYEPILGDVAELGCGYGTFTLPLARRIGGTVHTLDIDARYHVGVLELAGGEAGAALAQADSIRRLAPTHLFGFMLRARALETRKNPGAAQQAYRDFLKNERAERARQRPEYAEHAQNLDAFHTQALEATSGNKKAGA